MDVPPTKAANGKAVVLLHGKNFYGAYWAGTIAALTDAGFRVVVPDQIGFGKSSKPDIAYSFDGLARNTAALLDALKIPKASVVGHSMGGKKAATGMWGISRASPGVCKPPIPFTPREQKNDTPKVK